MLTFEKKKFTQCNDEIEIFITQNRKGYLRKEVKWRYTPLTKIRDTNALAIDSGTVVGMTTIFTKYLLIESSVKILADKGHSQVDGNYQGQGIFYKLNLDIENEAFALGVDCLIAITNEMAKGVYIKQKWEYIGNLFVLSRRINIFLKLNSILPSVILCKLINKVFRFINSPKKIFFINSKGYEFTEINVFNDDFEKLCYKLNQEIPILRLRNEEYLNWRFKKEPLKNYKILSLTKKNKIFGYAVFLFEPEYHSITIVDFIAIDNKEQILFKKIVGYLNTMDESLYSNVSIGVSEKNYFYHIIQKAGFNKIGKKLPIVIKQNINLDKPDNLLSNIKNWHITFADKDTV